MVLVGTVRTRVRAVAALAALVVAGGALTLVGGAPAEAAAPSVAFFRGETLAITAPLSGTGDSMNYLRASMVIKHDVGVTVTGMKTNPMGATSGAYGAVQGRVSTTAGSQYTLVEAEFRPGTGEWPGFSRDIRMRQHNACVRVQTSAGELPEQCWNFKTAAESESGPVNDYPVPFENSGTTQGAVFTTGATTFHVGYKCDDNDTGTAAHSKCDQAMLRVRNVGTNQTVTLNCATDAQSGAPCETRTGSPAGTFNADDNTRRDFDLRKTLGRGKWIIEAMYANEDNVYPAQGVNGPYDWSWLGYFYVNPTAPTLSLNGSASAGTVARPNTGATVTYSAVASDDLQFIEWDLNQNTADGFEDRAEALLNFSGNQGGTVDLGSAAFRTIDTSTMAEGADCSVRAQGTDNAAIIAVALPAGLTRPAPVATSAACQVNRQPTGADQGPLAATPGTSTTVNLVNIDGDGDPMSCEIVTGPTKGAVAPSGACGLAYQPTAGSSGSDSLTYRVRDDHGGVSATHTVRFDITAVATTPPVANPDAVSTDTNVALTVSPLTNDTVGGSGPITIAGAGSGNGPGTTAAGGTVTCTATTCTYTPPAGYAGSDAFTYSIVDADSRTSSSTVTVTVVGNRAPIAVDDFFVLTPGVAYSDNVLTNDSEPDGETLTATVLTSPASGTLALSLDGSFTYTPASATPGTDTFTYRVCDNHTSVSSAPLPACSEATVTLTTPAAPAPQPVATEDRADTDVDQAVTIPVLTNDTNGTGDVADLSISFAGHAGTAGTTEGGGTVSCTTTCTYTPAAGFRGTDVFTYTITNGTNSAQAYVIVNVVGNTAPVAGDDAFTTDEDTAVSGSVAGNDLDADEDLLTYDTTPAAAPAHGTVTIAADGTFTYTPDAGFSGTDSFRYRVCDDHQLVDETPAPACTTATVTLTVRAKEEPPVSTTTTTSEPVTTTSVDQPTTTVVVPTSVGPADTTPPTTPPAATPPATLPRTGSSALPLVGLGLSFVTLGALVVSAGRRRLA